MSHSEKGEADTEQLSRDIQKSIYITVTYCVSMPGRKKERSA